MNKQRFLAELQRLLVFMTAEDRAETLRRYSDLFAAAGPEGESDLLNELGSPTKAAISLSRGYEPGKLSETLPVAPEKKARPAALTETQEDPWGDLPSFDLPDYLEEDEGKKNGQERSFSMPDLPGFAAPAEREKKNSVTRSMPLGLGIPLFVLVVVGLGIPLAAVLIAAVIILLVPGCAVLFAAYLTAIGGLWCIGFMADAILMFGAAFVVLALGIVLLFGGLYLDVKLVELYIRGLRWVAGELLGRRTARDE